MEDIFKFVAFRPASCVSQHSKLQISIANLKSAFQGRLMEARAASNALEQFREEAKQYITSNNHEAYTAHLRYPLLDIAKQLIESGYGDQSVALAIIIATTGRTPKELEDDADFINDVNTLKDIIVAQTILHNEDQPYYRDLLLAIRVASLVSSIASGASSLNQPNSIRKMLSATVELPKSIFPLPAGVFHPSPVYKPTDPNTSSNGAEYRKQLAHRLEILKAAQEELQHFTYSDFEVKETANKDFSADQIAELANLSEAQGRQIQNPEILAYSRINTGILKQEAIGRLTKKTNEAIHSLAIELGKTQLNIVKQKIEKAISDTACEYYAPKSPQKVANIERVYLNPSDPHPLQNGLSNKELLGDAQIGAVNKIGFGDLYVIRQELIRYETGDVAHIENVLRGEIKERTHRRTQKTEETFLVETEKTEESERNLQSTERYEMQTEAQQVLKSENKFDTNVSVKYGGFVDLSSSLTTGSNDSQEDSRRTATNYGREVTEQTISRIQERVREQRVNTTITEFEEINKHSLQNNQPGSDHISGIYCWVDKVYKAQNYNYGWRLLYEFIIPEPAHFLRLNSSLLDDETPIPPMRSKEDISLDEITLNNINGILTDYEDVPLKPEHINRLNYTKWVAQYKIADLEAPPPQKRWLSVTKSNQKESKGCSPNDLLVFESATENLKIMDGYRAVYAHIAYHSRPYDGLISISIGGIQSGFLFDTNTTGFPLNGEVGFIPVAIRTEFKANWAIAIEIECELTTEGFRSWQQKAYDAIMLAYKQLLSDYEEKISAKEIQEGIAIQGQNEGANRETEANEIKKACMVLLHRDGVVQQGIGAIIPPNLGDNQSNAFPEIDPNRADQLAPYIRFLEQGFEWHNMMYTFYPYYWANKSAWPALLKIQDTDPLYARFLRSGAARVVVPVRPGYEDSILWYMNTGEPFKGEKVVGVSSPMYVPIVEEIKEKQNSDYNSGAGAITVTNGLPTVIGHGTYFSNEDVGREILIQNIKYHIKAVISSSEILLEVPYAGPTAEALRYLLGAKRIGDPWEVRVPTSLVMLQKDDQLPDYTARVNR